MDWAEFGRAVFALFLVLSSVVGTIAAFMGLFADNPVGDERPLVFLVAFFAVATCWIGLTLLNVP